MLELDFMPLNGLFNEFYNPDLNSIINEPLQTDNPLSLRRANGLFWAQLFDARTINDVISVMILKYTYSTCDIPQYAAILSNPQLFINRVQLAISQIVNQGIDDQEFFSHVETLSILCKLYSDFRFYPFSLTISDGILLNDVSSKFMIENCLNPVMNPYLEFLQKECFPIIAEYPSNIIWIHGRIHMSTLAMATYAKQLYPSCYVFVVDHSSEYYSLNKITRFLKRNKILFSVIDAIVIEDTNDIRDLLRTAVSGKISFAEINNILYIDRNTGNIIQTDYSSELRVSFSDFIQTRPVSFPEKKAKMIDPSEIVNAKLYPECICPWSNCSFCGINKKYNIRKYDCFNETLSDRVKQINELVNEGKHYFWFYDEAVLPDRLNTFADLILEKELTIIWHVRSRIDLSFTEDLCKKLSKSGLREIRFGLESASSDVLFRMNKFKEDFQLQHVESLVSNFHKAGVSVHFPIIIGFPGETILQRKETYAFLMRMKTLYPSISFNINILQLDVTSKLYSNFEDYDITQVKLPCSPQYYLGNFADWDNDDASHNTLILEREQSDIMKELLYPWFPESAITKPNIFYRLAESIRNTLPWKEALMKDDEMESPTTHFSNKLVLKLSPWTVKIKKEAGKAFTIFYDFRYNIFYQVDDQMASYIELYSNRIEVETAINIINKSYNLTDQEKAEITEYTKDWFSSRILIEEV